MHSCRGDIHGNKKFLEKMPYMIRNLNQPDKGINIAGLMLKQSRRIEKKKDS